MPYRRIAIYLSGIIFTVAVAASESFACSCARPDAGTPVAVLVGKAKKQSDAIFFGRVLSVVENQDDGFTSVELEVLGVWKGQLSKKVTIRTGIHDGNCRFPFEQDKTYLVFAQESTMYSTVKALSTGICTRTAEMVYAKADIRVLGKQKKPRD